MYDDVADHRNMTKGPGIVLVAHDANVHIDETGGRRGFLYTQKALLPGSNQERLRIVLRAALENCRKLEQESAVRGKLKFSGDEVLISVNDRLVAPNTTESFQSLKPDVEAVAGQLFNPATFAFRSQEDSRRRLSLALRPFERFDVDGLIANIGGEAKYG